MSEPVPLALVAELLRRSQYCNASWQKHTASSASNASRLAYRRPGHSHLRNRCLGSTFLAPEKQATAMPILRLTLPRPEAVPQVTSSGQIGHGAQCIAAMTKSAIQMLCSLEHANKEQEWNWSQGDWTDQSAVGSGGVRACHAICGDGSCCMW